MRASARMIQKMGQAKKPIAHMIQFSGGVDLQTPPLSLPPGFLRASNNWEAAVTGGYERVTGYERYDGRAAPSAGTYSIISITLTGSIAVGNTVTGVTSAATGYVIAVATGYIAVTQIVGTFVSGEVLNVAASPQATTTSAARLNAASTLLLHAQYTNLAADVYRALIAAPTGSGNNLGGVRFNGVTYCFRNAANGLTANLWKSTSSGWSQVTLYNEISFTAGGATQPAEGTTLTQGGVTAVIKRVVLTSGAWASNNAAGRLIITNPAGGNFAAGAATDGAINFTLTAIQTAISILPDGRYKIVKDNFGGSVASIRLYGCDGVNRGFEFDGSIYVPITTGMTADTPNHVYVHKNHLFYSFGSSVQHAAPGTPYIWSVILGAAEIGMGDTVTGFMTQPGSESTGALAIFSRNKTSVLYGTGVSNWNLITYRKELGAYPYTIQDIGYTMFLDDQGVTSLQTAQTFGNFAHNAVTARVKTWLNTKRTKAVESCVSRDKSQYRLFFSDGYALYATFAGAPPSVMGNTGNKIIGLMQVQMPDPVTWACSSEEPDGTETIFFGSTDGMVYQMEKGTSFDGDAISHQITTAWDFCKSPRTIKNFMDGMLEVSGLGYAELSVSNKVSYGATDVLQPITNTEVVEFDQAIWNQITWNQFVWNGTSLTPSIVEVSGEGVNVSLFIRGSSDYHSAVKLSGAVIHYVPRREARG